MASKHTAHLLLVLFSSMALPTLGHAQTEKPPVTVSDLDAILQEEILLKAMASRAKQRAELGRFDSAAQTADLTNPTLPQLAWRRSTASGWLAKLYLNDGSSVIVSHGELLPGGYVVAQINENGVKLKHNDELIDLTAASSGASTPSQNSTPSAMMPPSFVPPPQGRLP